MTKFSPELLMLGMAVIIGVVQLMWAAGASRASGQDLKWAGGPRDEERPVGVVAGRLNRAYTNFIETFPLFAAALLAAGEMGKFGTLTLWGAGLYVAGRAFYVPVYAAGIPRLRSLIWAISMVGLILVIVAIFR